MVESACIGEVGEERDESHLAEDAETVVRSAQYCSSMQRTLGRRGRSSSRLMNERESE